MKFRTSLQALTLLSLAATASAQSATYRITQSVGSLSMPQVGIADPYLFLDFQLTDGKGTGDGNAVVTVSNLTLSGGAFDYGDRRLADIGSVTGPGFFFNLRGDAPVSDRAVLFRVTSPTAVLAYDLTFFSTGTDSPTPDGFNVAMLYRTGPDDTDVNVVPTLGPTGNEMAAYTFDGFPTTNPMVYGVDGVVVKARVPAAEAERYTGIGTPVVSRPVPEPTTLVAFAAGGLCVLRRRRR